MKVSRRDVTNRRRSGTSPGDSRCSVSSMNTARLRAPFRVLVEVLGEPQSGDSGFDKSSTQFLWNWEDETVAVFDFHKPEWGEHPEWWRHRCLGPEPRVRQAERVGAVAGAAHGEGTRARGARTSRAVRPVVRDRPR